MLWHWAVGGGAGSGTCRVSCRQMKVLQLLLQITGTMFCYSCATSRTIPGSIPGGVTGDFFRSSFRQNHVPWGRLSLWKWAPGISSGVKAAGAYGWWSTTLVVSNVEMIWGLNLTGTPTATSACRGTLLHFMFCYSIVFFQFSCIFRYE